MKAMNRSSCAFKGLFAGHVCSEVCDRPADMVTMGDGVSLAIGPVELVGRVEPDGAAEYGRCARRHEMRTSTDAHRLLLRREVPLVCHDGFLRLIPVFASGDAHWSL
jgi:hypothetical protein